LHPILINQKNIYMEIVGKYSPEEWDTLSVLPMLIGTAMTAASDSGFFGTAKEAFVSSQLQNTVVEDIPQNALIRAVIKRPADFSEAKTQVSEQFARLKKLLNEEGAETPEAIKAVTIKKLKHLAENLMLKEEPSIAEAFQKWLVAYAEKVANAASEGGFLGFGGKKVSDAEQTFINEIKSSMGYNAFY